MNFFKKQGVAWVLTALMIVIALGISAAKSDPHVDTPIPTNPPSVIVPDRPSSTVTDAYFVRDDAYVLTSGEISKLSKLNRELADDLGVVIGCVTTNYGGDLYTYALRCAEEMGLGQHDFIVVLDISGENYWLVQGTGLVNLFTDNDCIDYAWEYMEKSFARGDYGEALLKLTDALADWYDHYFG